MVPKGSTLPFQKKKVTLALQMMFFFSERDIPLLILKALKSLDTPMELGLPVYHTAETTCTDGQPVSL